MPGLIILLTAIGLGLILYFVRSGKERKRIAAYQLPWNATQLLNEHVPFYQKLDADKKAIFTERVRDFLARTRITGISGTRIDDLDRLLVAAGAIIPIFAFTDWRYNNLDEVLVYENSFNMDYHTHANAPDRNILGMVGNGALNRKMLLSKPAIRSGFMDAENGHNTVVHEFAHLIDKADGAVDGVPEYLLSKQYAAPWLKYMHNEIQQMRQFGSDINPYAATNQAEFFAVMSEYFFERPEQLEQNHPELYCLLQKMFTPQPSGK